MKNLNRFQKLLAAMLLLAAITVVMSLSALADTIPSKVRAYPNSTSSVSITLTTPGDYIKNIKGQKMKTKLTYLRYADDEETEATITFMPKKKGKLKLTFDIYGHNGSKKSTKTITVYSYPDSPVKKVTYGGKQLYGYGIKYKNSGKLKVKMNKGYKLLKIEVGKYEEKARSSSSSTGKETSTVYKTVKNGAKITLGNKGYYYLYDYKSDSYYRHSMSSSVYAPTYIRITYKDKYTKQENTLSYYMEKSIW